MVCFHFPHICIFLCWRRIPPLCHDCFVFAHNYRLESSFPLKRLILVSHSPSPNCWECSMFFTIPYMLKKTYCALYVLIFPNGVCWSWMLLLDRFHSWSLLAISLPDSGLWLLIHFPSILGIIPELSLYFWTKSRSVLPR